MFLNKSGQILHTQRVRFADLEEGEQFHFVGLEGVSLSEKKKGAVYRYLSGIFKGQTAEAQPHWQVEVIF